MVATVDVSECDLLSLPEALKGQRAAARVRLFEGGQRVAPMPMMWPCPLDEASRPHREMATAPHGDVHVISRALVGGEGAQAVKDGAYLYAETAYPGYVRAYLDGDVSPEVWAFKRGWGSLKTLRVERAFALVHFNLMWGHWLTEVFPKLFLIRHLAELGVRAPILVPATVPFYVAEIIDDVLPGQELIVYEPATHKVAVKQLLLPAMLQRDYVFHPVFGEMIDGYAATAAPLAESSRVFVSRTNMKTPYAYRELTNEAEIEAVAAELGFRIVIPDRLPWREELATFAGARVVAGEFGSGLHNALFSPAGAKVVAMNWIVNIQSRIANFRKQDLGYVLPDDGAPRTFQLKRTLQRFRIDPGEFRRRLEFALRAAEAT